MSDGREVVFRGTLEECQDFVRANRFSVTLSCFDILATTGGFVVLAFIERGAE